MTMVSTPSSAVNAVELSWDEVAEGHFPPSPWRQAFEAAVAELAERARQAVPEAASRLERAVELVLSGAVKLLPEGAALVASQGKGGPYRVENGACSCKDFPKAPRGLCKHRLAFGLAKKATALVRERVQGEDGEPRADEAPLAETPQAGEPAAAAPLAFPEAPASVNVHVVLAGRSVLITLRDLDEERLLQRLEKLLARFPAPEAAPEPADDPSWCKRHGVRMKRRGDGKASWYSHRLEDGTWCRGK